MTPVSPPPWLWMQQRYGPPPSYPNLRIPGLNSGDVFGVYVEEKATKKLNPEEEKLWGEIPENAVEEEDEEEEREAEVPVEEEKKEEEVPVPADVVIPGSETPAAIQLRKEAGDETPYEPKSLYTHLEEVEVSGGEGFMPPTKKYVIPSSK